MYFTFKIQKLLLLINLQTRFFRKIQIVLFLVYKNFLSIIIPNILKFYFLFFRMHPCLQSCTDISEQLQAVSTTLLLCTLILKIDPATVSKNRRTTEDDTSIFELHKIIAPV